MSWRRDESGNVEDPDGTGPVNEDEREPRDPRGDDKPATS